jgi:hypothetical protein
MEKFRNILETNKKNEDEIVKLIMENIVLKIENENLQVSFCFIQGKFHSEIHDSLVFRLHESLYQ